jgi:hypothetical protein
MKLLRPYLPLWKGSESTITDERQIRKSRYLPRFSNNWHANHVQLRMTDQDTPVSPHSFQHMNPIFCADALTSFELESFC